MTRHVSALLVGGGISGLVCAYALRKARIDAQLIEASPRPGGVINSVTRNGFLLELGPQSFSSAPSLQDLCHELGIENQILVAPRAPRFVLIDGSLRPVPMSPPAFFTSSFVSVKTKWSILRDAFGRSVPPANDETVAAFVRRKFTPELLEKLVGPFISGIYAGDPEKLSLGAAFPQLHDAETQAGSVVRGLVRLGKQLKQSGRPRRTLLTFREGNETIVRALANKLGSALHTGTKVADISRQNEGTFQVSLQNRTGSESISTKSLILATPTDITAKLLCQLDSSFESPLSSIDYAAVAVVSLSYRKQDIGHELEGFGFLVPRSAGLRVLGSVWNSSLFPGRAPEGHALLTSFVGGTTDPAATKLKPEELVSLVHREIFPVLSIKCDPLFSNVTIWPRALPQYNLGHGDRLAAVAKSCSRFPGLWLTGNYLRGPAIGSCVDQALAVAEEVRSHLAT